MRLYIQPSTLACSDRLTAFIVIGTQTIYAKMESVESVFHLTARPHGIMFVLYL